MRRAIALLVLVLGSASVASSAGAFLCSCCDRSADPAVEGADLCCPDGDATRCASLSTQPKPASPWTTIAEASRPLVLPDRAVSPIRPLALVELRAIEGRPSGREGLAMRSILRI
jgi:hypothetical protein